MKTNIGLNDEARLEVGSMLNLLLADEKGEEASQYQSLETQHSKS